MGMIGRASIVHFAGVMQCTWTGKPMNGIRLIRIHRKVAASAGITNEEEIIVESPRGSVRGTALHVESKR